MAKRHLHKERIITRSGWRQKREELGLAVRRLTETILLFITNKPKHIQNFGRGIQDIVEFSLMSRVFQTAALYRLSGKRIKRAKRQR